MANDPTEQVRSNAVLVLDKRLLKPFEIGARLDALLCYPTWSFQRQQQIADAICTVLVTHSIRVDPSRKGDLTRQYPQYSKERRRTALGSLDERRKKTLTFGAALLPLLKNEAIGKLPIFQGQERELTGVEVARHLWPPREGGTEVNYEERLHDRQRELRSYRPIAHLAAAYQYIARERSGSNKEAAFDYQDNDLHQDAVWRASEFAGYFRAVPALKAIGDRLIDIEWRE